MIDESQIRQQIERKIRMMKKGVEEKKDLFDFSSSIDAEIESMRESMHSEKQVTTSSLDNDELESRLKQEREKMHQIQMSIDKLRGRMLQIVREEEKVKESINEKRKNYDQMKDKIAKEHKGELEGIDKKYETKRQNLLKQHEQLIREKDDLIKNAQSLSEILKKADRQNKDRQERYNNDIKAQKEAFLALERERCAKYEKNRIKQLKEQAIIDTEPKLRAIMKSANDDIKKSEEKERQAVQTFKNEYKIKLEKDLTSAKQRIFEQTENQKQQLRIDIERKNKQKLQEKERQFELESTNMKEQYNQRIKQEEKKIRADIEEFIMRNKDSHNTNIDEIRQLKANYESRLKKMNENLKEIKESKLKEYEEKYRKQAEEAMRQIDASNADKFVKAQQKIKKESDDKMAKIAQQISKDKNLFIEDINRQQQKRLMKEKTKYEEMVAREKRGCETYEVNLIEIQKNKSKEEAKTKELRKERNNLAKKNEELERKIKNHEAQLQAYEQFKMKKDREIKKKCDDFNQQKQEQLQKLQKLYLAKSEIKENKVKKLFEQYQQEQSLLQSELQEYHTEIEEKITTLKGQLKRMFETNAKIQRQNDTLQKQIEDHSRKIIGP